MATIAETFEAARRFHQAGALPQAEQLYRQVLQVDPRHAETLHLLGVVALQAGNFAGSIQYVQAALTVTPSDGRFYATLGLAQRSLNQFDDALASFRQSVALMPQSAEAHYNLALAQQQLGQWNESAASYQQALALKDDFVPAHNNLGNVFLELNQPNKAVVHFQQAVRLNPGHVSAHTNLGVALRRLGRLEEAAASYQRALSLAPNSAQALNNQGSLLQAQGKLEEAAACLQQALRHEPNLPDVHLNLGVVRRGQGRRAEAIEHLLQAIALRPLFAEGYLQLGITREEQGDTSAAEEAYRQALAFKPDHADAANRLGVLLQKQGQLEQAVACLRQLLAVRPDSVEAHNNLGSTLCKQAKFAEASRCFRQALKLKPDCAEAYNNLGSLLAGEGNLEEAADCYRRALHLKPNEPDSHAGLAGVLHDQGFVNDAIAGLEQALNRRPSDRLRVSLATCLPIIYQSENEVLHWRQRFTEEIQKLREQEVKVDVTDDPALPLFYLTYQGFNDRDLQREAALLYRAPSPSLGRRGPDGKIRVGFLSSFFKGHTIGHWMRGLVAQLSRQDFTVVVLSCGNHEDDVAAFFKQHADHFVDIPRHLPAARQVVARQHLDILFYADIGMDPLSYTLAMSRLAPVQCVTLGHPVTTGIESVDYFISSQDLESEQAQQQYTEKLVRLDHLPIHYYKPKIPADLKPRDFFGLSEGAHVYACLQSLFKFHPRFDPILAAILRGDARGVLVLPSGRSANVEEQLRTRFSKTMPDVLDRIRFFAPLGYADYLNLLAVVDVQLDPLPFGGGNTSFDGFALGNPIVTMPSELLRGRITSALSRQMGVLDCVVATAEEYVDKALQLGTDSSYREWIRERILAAHDGLFENSAGVRDLEKFFRSVCE